MDKPKDMTRAELADALNISRNQAYRLLRAGEIDSYMVGPEYRVTAEALARFKAKGGSPKRKEEK